MDLEEFRVRVKVRVLGEKWKEEWGEARDGVERHWGIQAMDGERRVHGSDKDFIRNYVFLGLGFFAGAANPLGRQRDGEEEGEETKVGNAWTLSEENGKFRCLAATETPIKRVPERKDSRANI